MPSRRASARGNGKASSERLAPYRAKRDFATTPEPPPKGARRKARLPRFVIHEHSARRLHWDLRLERDGVLASWALPKGLPEAPRDNRFAAHTEDHPLEYIDFHGEIPKGQYGAGQMTIWDHGTYEPLKWEPRKVEVALHGERVEGRYALFAIGSEEQPKEWMIHRMDPPADAGREAMPEHLVPMLARAGALPPAEEAGWAYEIKWDGIRALAYSRPGTLRLESRNLIDVTDRYPELARLNRALSSHEAVLDGEIVAFDDDGRPSFEALQQRMQLTSRSQAKRQSSARPVTYVIFDLLWLDGHSVMTLPYQQRRELLGALELDGERWQTPEHVVGHGAELLAAAREQRLEGVVAKRLQSSYRPGARSRDWIKVKTVGRQELVIGGWMPGKGKRAEHIGALLVGVYEDGALRYAGRVGTGFSEHELKRLERLLTPLQRRTSPFTLGPKPPRGAVFVEPRLVAEVEFAEWTRAGSLRAPSYKGLRDDKQAQEVTREGAAPDDERVSAPASSEPDAEGPLVIREQTAKTAYATVGGRELKLSNLDKVLYPAAGFSKRDVISYYATIAPHLLAHLAGRALTVTRWPDGVAGKSFFQKQVPAHRPDWVKTVSLPSERKPIDYIVVQDASALVWLANLAALELHTPLARAAAPDCPDFLVFDLDPGPPASIIECCRVALLLNGMFENLGLQSFVKTSGSKGLQVYVPLNRPEVAFAQTKPFARAVAEMLQEAEPDLIVSLMTKSKRTGRVLIDWSQNDRNKTTVCVYSLRARERPTASTPLEWDEVQAALRHSKPERLAFEARDVLARVAERGDLFAPLLSLVQQLPSL